jgi:hypothetical protein
MTNLSAGFRSFIDQGHDLRKSIPGRVQEAANAQWEKSKVESIRKVVSDYFGLVAIYSFRIGLWLIFIPLIVEIAGLVLGMSSRWFYLFLNVWFAVITFVSLYAFSPVFVLVHAVRRIPGDKQYRELLAIFWLNLDLLVLGINTAFFAYAFFSLAFSTTLPIAVILAIAWLGAPYLLYAYKADMAYAWVRLGQTIVMFLVACVVAASPVPMRHYQSWVGRAAANELRPEEQRDVTANWAHLQWFTQEGSPNVWYSGSAAQGYHLFAAPGYDPQTNEKLKPVSDNETKEEIIASFRARSSAIEKQAVDEANQRKVALIEQQAAQERNRIETEKRQIAETKAKMLRDYVARPSQTAVSPQRPIVLIALQNNEEVIAQSERFSAVLNSAGLPNRITVFSAEFVGSATFKALLQGKREPETLFDAAQFASYFLIINTTSSASTQQVDGVAVPTIDLRCDVRLISSSTARVEHSVELKSRGAGFDEAIARKQANERIEAELRKAAPDFIQKSL